MHFETEKKAKLSDINRDIMVKQAELEQSNRQKTLDQFITFDSRLLDLKQSDEANKLRLYDSRIAAWEKRIRIFIDINQSIIEQFGQLIEVYAKEVGLEISKKEILLNQYNALNSYNSQLSTISLEKLKVMDSHNIGKYQALSEGQKAIGATLGQLSSTLFNTMNYSQSWSSSVGWSGSESVST